MRLLMDHWRLRALVRPRLSWLDVFTHYGSTTRVTHRVCSDAIVRSCPYSIQRFAVAFVTEINSNTASSRADKYIKNSRSVKIPTDSRCSLTCTLNIVFRDRFRVADFLKCFYAWFPNNVRLPNNDWLYIYVKFIIISYYLLCYFIFFFKLQLLG